MVSYAALRALVGKRRFDQAVVKFEASPSAAAKAPVALSSMGAEPENSGLSIAEGRRALKRASKERYALPELNNYK